MEWVCHYIESCWNAHRIAQIRIGADTGNVFIIFSMIHFRRYYLCSFFSFGEPRECPKISSPMRYPVAFYHVMWWKLVIMVILDVLYVLKCLPVSWRELWHIGVGEVTRCDIAVTTLCRSCLDDLETNTSTGCSNR